MYKWKLDTDYTIPFIHPDIEFEYAYVRNNKLTIKKEYAWNGCSPKFSLFGLKTIGIPDGHIDYRTGKEFCYYATLVHDALYQYKIGTKIQADSKFYVMLNNFPPKEIYYWSVCKFGKW